MRITSMEGYPMMLQTSMARLGLLSSSLFHSQARHCWIWVVHTKNVPQFHYPCGVNVGLGSMVIGRYFLNFSAETRLPACCECDCLRSDPNHHDASISSTSFSPPSSSSLSGCIQQRERSKVVLGRQLCSGEIARNHMLLSRRRRNEFHVMHRRTRPKHRISSSCQYAPSARPIYRLLYARYE
jgi:hypothetical protein